MNAQKTMIAVQVDRPMHRSYLLASFVLFSALASGCGSLASDTDHLEPLAVLQGELRNPDGISTSGKPRVAVIWICGSIEGDTYRVSQDVAVQPEFPSRFRVELTEPPPAECMLTPNIGIGSIAAYDDVNGNRKLDLVGPNATENTDTLLAANHSSWLVYFEGSVQAQHDSDGNLPSLGYNLLEVEANEAYDMTGPAGPAALCGYGVRDPEASNGLRWLDPGSPIELTVTADAQLSAQMCPEPGWEDWIVGVYAEGQTPAQYPSPGDPSLTCMEGGLYYFYRKTCAENTGVCGGKSCTGECWYVPDAANPPAGWPCPIQ